MIRFSVLGPITVHFNGATLPCRWQYSPSPDSQWEEIRFSFDRHRRVHTNRNPWATGHYTRVSSDLWMLNYQPRNIQIANHWTETSEHQGTYHNVPLKILGLNGYTREPPTRLREPMTLQNNIVQHTIIHTRPIEYGDNEMEGTVANNQSARSEYTTRVDTRRNRHRGYGTGPKGYHPG